MSSTRPMYLILALLLCAAPALARAQVPDAPAPPVVSQRDCFGLFESYDAWMDFLWKKNNVVAYLAIRWKFPREDYERYRRTLDCRAITYRSDGHLVQGWLVRPKLRAGQKAPVVIYNRGGNRGLGALTFGHLFMHVFPLAEQGFFVAASQYRGAVPTPGEKRSPDEFGGADVRDVTRLMRLVVRHPRADAGNVFMIGHSRGAIMAFRALLDAPVPVRAAVIYSGVYDLRELNRFRPGFDTLYKELIPDYARNARAELDRRSVVRWPERLPAATGLLLIHGEDDERAPVASARRFDAQLTRLGREHKALFYPGEGHFLDGHREEVLAETVAWFRRHQARPASARATAAP